MTGAVVGALYPLNSLDLPTYLVVVVGAMLLRQGLTRQTAIDASTLFVSAILVWLPFTARFVPFAGADESELPSWMRDLPVLPRIFTTIGWHDGERTSTSEFFTVFGLFWAIGTVYLVWRAVRQVRDVNPVDCPEVDLGSGRSCHRRGGVNPGARVDPGGASVGHRIVVTCNRRSKRRG